ncbi:peptidylprolyl isomerase [Candidatus Micrarchaeota archaeon]|nr:peptidylprolyl isomerase [Candidatus Micrarchaeota archaeon]
MQVQNGDTVKVDYVGSTEGKVFDTSIEAEAKKAGFPFRSDYAPLEFSVGAKQVIPGFEQGVLGMKVGDEKTVVIPPEDAYGPVQEEAIVQIPLDQFQDASQAKVGGQVFSPQGQRGFITAVANETITVDFNHELAGKTLTFKITVRDIQRPAS